MAVILTAMTELILGKEVYAVIGAAMEVHSELGNGYIEAVYQESLELELTSRSIPFDPQKRLTLYYKNTPLKKEYVPDLICYDELIVEIKTVEHLTNKEIAQLLNYLYSTKLKVGILINFGSRGQLEWKRFVL